MKVVPWSERLKGIKNKPLWQPSETTQTVNYGREEIEKVLPHREPFLLLDVITAVDVEQQSTQGARSIADDDTVFTGHFPGEPVYPGALLVEMMGQLGVALIYFCNRHTHLINESTRPLRARVIKVHHAAFFQEVLPGDELTILAKLMDFNEFTAVCAGQILRGETVCALAIFEVYLVGE